MADKTATVKVDGRTTRRSETFLTLVDYLKRNAEMSEVQNWPVENLWNYDTGASGDTMAWRIRHGKIKLPDVYGGTNGKWGASVERVKKGRAHVNGPCRVWVWYEGENQ